MDRSPSPLAISSRALVMAVTGRTMRWRKYQTMKLIMPSVRNAPKSRAWVRLSSRLSICPSKAPSNCASRNCSTISARALRATQYSKPLTSTNRKRLDSFLVRVSKNCISIDSYKAFNVCMPLLLGKKISQWNTFDRAGQSFRAVGRFDITVREIRGRELARDGGGSVALMLDVPPLSRASSLPRGFGDDQHLIQKIYWE
ncbi:hypothetical protein EMIT043CA1_30002 [Pseudomonas brassicacearum]